MRIVIAGSGSQGDTRPYLALASGLRRRGHEAVVCLDRNGADLADRLGVPFHELAGDFRQHLEDGRGSRALERRDGGLAGLRLFRDVARAHTESWIDTITQAADRVAADVIVGSGLATFAALTAADATGRCGAVAGAFPLHPTAEFPSPVAPFVPPRLFDRATHVVAERGLWSAFARPTNRARRARGLPPMTPDWTGTPAIYGFSPALLPPPADWPDSVAVCGDWHLDEDVAPPPGLREFLEAGAPPVYVGFGSMAANGTTELTAAILAALDGRRAVLAPGWSGVDRSLGCLPESVFVTPPVAHSWLLPRCSFAVHHCGAGTTHAAARAGIPSVPVPFAADQPFWARRLRAVGIGTAPLDRRSPTVAAARAAFTHAESPVLRGAALEVARAMADDDPVGAAVHHLGATAARRVTARP